MQPKRRKPTHPGQVLLEEFLLPLGISPAQCAKNLGKGWTEKKVQALINGEENVSDKIAEELAVAFSTTAHFWKHLQQFCNEYDAIHKQNEKGALKPWKIAQ